MSNSEITQAITPLLQKYGVSYAGVFGSFARGEETKDSDIDLFITFKKESTPSLVGYIAMRNELEKILKREVDVVTNNGVNKRLRPIIMSEMKEIYSV